MPSQSSTFINVHQTALARSFQGQETLQENGVSLSRNWRLALEVQPPYNLRPTQPRCSGNPTISYPCPSIPHPKYVKTTVSRSIAIKTTVRAPFFLVEKSAHFRQNPELVQQNLEKTVSLGLNMFESASCKSWARKRSWKCCHAMGAPPSKPRPSPKSRW